VDGTLVGSDGGVHPAVWEAAARARGLGIRLALCSGRPAFGVTGELAARLDADGWHCFQNGASVLQLGTGRSHSIAFPAAAIDELIARAHARHRLLELYTDDDYAFDGPPERARDHAALLGVPFRPRPISGLTGKVVRGQWLVGHDETDLVLAEPHPGLEVSLSASPAMPDTRFINLTAGGVDKGSAVRAIAEEYRLPLSEVMFVGDSGNDAAAMRIVGWPVAMANAEAEARALARATVAHVDAGGVAEALLLAERAGH
jgi:Cof subfamily protein (haloacid dehalogenase superfamily)